MAYLGAIGRTSKLAQPLTYGIRAIIVTKVGSTKFESVPARFSGVYYGGDVYNGMTALTVNTNGRYKLRVTQNGVALPLARVALYFRPNQRFVDAGDTDANGYVEFKNLVMGAGLYYGVVLDPEGGVLQNAIINDRLTPVSMV